MKILLIQTGLSESLQKNLGFGNKYRLNMPMLGLLYIKEMIPDDISVDVVDETHGLISEYQYNDIVGISGMTMHALRMYQLADAYRELGCHVVLGGVHVSFMVEEALPHCNTVMIGEGELSWKQLIEDFKNGKPQKVYRPNETMDLAQLRKPDLSLIDGPAYHSPHGTLNSLVATRGCPNHCSFCCVKKMFDGPFRIRPVECVLEEIEGMNSDLIMFQDDNITGNHKFSEALFSEMKGMDRIWGGQSSINIANNAPLMTLLQESGCASLFIGFESINPKNIKSISKSGVNKTEKYGEMIQIIHDHGIGIVGSFIVGFDDDDEQVFDDIYEFVTRNNITFPVVNCLTPFPGTDLYQSLSQQDRIIDTNWEKYTLNNVVIQPKQMDADRLQYKYNSLHYHFSKIAKNTYTQGR